MTKLEEIARAIEEGDWLYVAWIESASIKSGFHVCRRDGAPDSYRPIAGPFATRDAADHETSIRRARLIVQAMREPSEAMIVAYIETARRPDTVRPGARSVTLCYQAMLDAILDEAPGEYS